MKKPMMVIKHFHLLQFGNFRMTSQKKKATGMTIIHASGFHSK